MRIAIVGSRGYPSTYGGFETLVRYLSQYLASSGHEVHVYGRPRGRWGFRHREASVGPIRVHETAGLNTKALSTLTFGFTSIAHASLVLRPDVVIAVNVALGHFLWLPARNRIPVVMNVDGLEWERAKWGWVGRLIFWRAARKAAKSAAVLVADAKEIARKWSALFGCSLLFIPYGAEALPVRGPEALRDIGITARGYILIVARLVPENSIEVVLSALRIRQSALPVVVVGDAEPGSPTRAAVEVANAEQQVIWLGHVHDQLLLHTLWRYCAIYVHGHTAGGTNPALLQALANAAPTLALANPFSREVLGPDYPLTEPNVEAIAKRIDALTADEEERERLAILGVKRVNRLYRWDNVCREYEKTCAQAQDRARTGLHKEGA